MIRGLLSALDLRVSHCVRIMSAAVLRRYGSGHLAVVEALISHARDRQRWDKMVLWSRVYCRNQLYASAPRAATADVAWEEARYDEAKARLARRRAAG